MRPTLLVTDDSMIIREKIKDVALQNGWDVVGEAENGQEAIEAFARLRPAAVTLDMVMPEFDGLHALRGIRQLDGTARVLIVSAIDQMEIFVEAVQLGAIDFVLKPFTQERLQSGLQKMRALARPATSLK